MSNKQISTSTIKHEQPDISVIIPNYNGANYLREAIDSALNQTGVTVEIIVVDDGSTDGSREILESYGARIRTFYQENKGAPAARNLGWKNANAEYIKFLDSDDVLENDCCQKQIRNMNSKSEIPFGDVKYINDSGELIDGVYKLRTQLPNESGLAYILQNNPLTSSPLHQKSQLAKVDGFNEDLIKGQEWDLHLRLFLAGFSFKYHQDFVYRFRLTDNPNRYSHTALTKESPDYFYDVFEEQVKKIQEKISNLSNYERVLLGKKYWTYGRGVLREGYPNEAKRYFERAKELGGQESINGSILYRYLTRVFSPNISERLLSVIR
ncbi:MAG: glycosyltransferase family 2 protein [Bacteroidota bacterium]